MTLPPLTPDQARRLAAKRNEERVKLLADAIDAAAAAVLGAAVTIPAVNDPASLLSPEPVTMNTQTVFVAAVTAVLFGGVYLWLRDSVRKFDQTYGRTDDRQPGE